jgi:hypothetical protein
MNTPMHQISIPAILAASVAVMLLGGIWFAWLFARQYAVVLGRADEPKTAMAPLYFVGPSLCMLLTTIGSAILMAAQGVSSLAEALRFGVVVGICFLATTGMNMAINPNIPRPIVYGVLSASYFLVSSMIISVTLFLLS